MILKKGEKLPKEGGSKTEQRNNHWLKVSILTKLKICSLRTIKQLKDDKK